MSIVIATLKCKATPVTIGAILAGVILGYLSLRKNSILTGVALHFSVAITMDIFALYHLGLL